MEPLFFQYPRGVPAHIRSNVAIVVKFGKGETDREFLARAVEVGILSEAECCALLERERHARRLRWLLPGRQKMRAWRGRAAPGLVAAV